MRVIRIVKKSAVILNNTKKGVFSFLRVQVKNRVHFASFKKERVLDREPKKRVHDCPCKRVVIPGEEPIKICNQ